MLKQEGNKGKVTPVSLLPPSDLSPDPMGSQRTNPPRDCRLYLPVSEDTKKHGEELRIFAVALQAWGLQRNQSQEHQQRGLLHFCLSMLPTYP